MNLAVAVYAAQSHTLAFDPEQEIVTVLNEILNPLDKEKQDNPNDDEQYQANQ
jgi:hypothetical protein